MDCMFDSLYINKDGVRLILSYTPDNIWTNTICKMTDSQIDIAIKHCKLFISQLEKMKE